MEPCLICGGDDERKHMPNWLGCLECSNRVLKWLREIEEYLPRLSLIKPVTGGENVSGPGFGSRSPANDAVLFHTDWRSGAEFTERFARDENGRRIWDPESEGWRMEPDGEPQLGALGVLGSWAAMVRDERRLATPKQPTLYTEVEVLRVQHPWVMQQEWVGDYATELRSVRVAVRALANDPVPRPVGKCIRFRGSVECKGDVYELPDASGVRCAKCSAIYTGLDLDRLRVAQEK